jgi:predicted  nucleic acid-binding Zn-ribbon protein
MTDGNHTVISHVLMTSPSASLYAPGGDQDTTETDSMIELMLRTMSDQMKELGERMQGMETRMQGMETRMQGMERHAHDMDKRLSADLSGISKSLEYLHAKAAASDEH